MMPFAGYKDFDACIVDQKKKGYSEESAKKICGMIHQRHKEKHAMKKKAYYD